MRTFVAAGLLLLQAAPAQEIRVREGQWGDASTADIRKVLESTAAVLLRHFPGRTLAPIEVSRGMESPITLYKKGPKGETLIRLNVEGTHWAQFAFQFAHEMGHVLCRHDEHESKENKWFEEMLCEVASIFALRRMGEEWRERPPYPNWKDYAKSLTAYADDRLRKAALPKGRTLAEWFPSVEPAMRANAELRENNTKVAAALLPLFEEEPGRWETVGSLPPGKSMEPRTLLQYLADWREAAPGKHRPFIKTLARQFGLELP